jgi:uncharacterized protein (TIGR02421 family)
MNAARAPIPPSFLTLIPGGPSQGPLPSPVFGPLIRELGDRLVAALKPLRILELIRWDEEVEERFFAAGARELPRVEKSYYQRQPLPFAPAAKQEELRTLQQEVRRRIGSAHPAGRLLLGLCREGHRVVALLGSRGTRAFGQHARQLWGSTRDPALPGGPALARLAEGLPALLEPSLVGVPETPCFDARQMVEVLAERLGGFFHEPGRVRVRLCRGLLADAAAEGRCLKVRADAVFAAWKVRLLEVHEGWVHLATTLNAQSQPACSFLGRCTPSSTATQEGLAVLTELLAGASHPTRVRRLADRVAAVALAEEGADFLEVYRFFQGQGSEPRAAYQQSVRVFRGSLPAGAGACTKDISYLRGLLQVADLLAVRPGQVSLLFAGKTNLADLPLLEELAELGLLAPPRYLPPFFADPVVRAKAVRAAWPLQEAARGKRLLRLPL